MLEDFFSRFVVYLNESEEHSSSAGANVSRSISNTSDCDGGFASSQKRQPINWNLSRPLRDKAGFDAKFQPGLGGDVVNEEGSTPEDLTGNNAFPYGVPPADISENRLFRKGQAGLEGPLPKSDHFRGQSTSKKTSEDDNRGAFVPMTSFRDFQTNFPSLKPQPLKIEIPHLKNNKNNKNINRPKTRKKFLALSTRLNSSAAIQKAHSSNERVDPGLRLSQSQNRDKTQNTPNKLKDSVRPQLIPDLNWEAQIFHHQEATGRREGRDKVERLPRFQSTNGDARREQQPTTRTNVSDASRKIVSNPSETSRPHPINRASDKEKEGHDREDTEQDSDKGGGVILERDNQGGNFNAGIQVLDAEELTMTNASNPSASTDQIHLFNLSSILVKGGQSDYEVALESPRHARLPNQAEEPKHNSVRGRDGPRRTKVEVVQNSFPLTNFSTMKQENLDGNNFFSTDNELPRNYLYHNVRKSQHGNSFNGQRKQGSRGHLEHETSQSLQGEQMDILRRVKEKEIEELRRAKKEQMEKLRRAKEAHWGKGQFLPDSHLKPFDGSRVQSREKSLKSRSGDSKNERIWTIGTSEGKERRSAGLMPQNDFRNWQLGDNYPEVETNQKPEQIRNPKHHFQSNLDRIELEPSPFRNFQYAKTKNANENNFRMTPKMDQMSQIIMPEFGNSTIPQSHMEDSDGSVQRAEAKRLLLENKPELKKGIQKYFSRKFQLKKHKKKRRHKKNRRKAAKAERLDNTPFVSTPLTKDLKIMNNTGFGDALINFDQKTRYSDRNRSEQKDISRNSRRNSRQTSTEYLRYINESEYYAHIVNQDEQISSQNRNLTEDNAGLQSNLNDLHNDLGVSTRPKTQKHATSYKLSQNFKSPQVNDRSPKHEDFRPKTSYSPNTNVNQSGQARLQGLLAKSRGHDHGKQPKLEHSSSKKLKRLGNVRLNLSRLHPTSRPKKNNLSTYLGKSGGTVKISRQTQHKIGKQAESRNQSQTAQSKNVSVQSYGNGSSRGKSLKRFKRGWIMNLSYKNKHSNRSRQSEKREPFPSTSLQSSGHSIRFNRSGNNSHKKRTSGGLKRGKLQGKYYRTGTFGPKGETSRTGHKSSFYGKSSQTNDRQPDSGTHISKTTPNFAISGNVTKPDKPTSKKKVVSLRDRFGGKIGRIKLGKLSPSPECQHLEDSGKKTVNRNDSSHTQPDDSMNFEYFQGLVDRNGRRVKEIQIPSIGQREITEPKTEQQKIKKSRQRNPKNVERALSGNLKPDFTEQPQVVEYPPRKDAKTQEMNIRKRTPEPKEISPPNRQIRNHENDNINRNSWGELKKQIEGIGAETMNIYSLNNLQSETIQNDPFLKNSHKDIPSGHYFLPNHEATIEIPNFTHKPHKRQPSKEVKSEQKMQKNKEESVQFSEGADPRRQTPSLFIKHRIHSESQDNLTPDTQLPRDLPRRTPLRKMSTTHPKPTVNEYEDSFSTNPNEPLIQRMIPAVRRVSETATPPNIRCLPTQYSSSNESLKIKKKEVMLDFDIFGSNNTSVPSTPKAPGAVNKNRSSGMPRRKLLQHKPRTPKPRRVVLKWGDESARKGNDIFKGWKTGKGNRTFRFENDGKVKQKGRGRSLIERGRRKEEFKGTGKVFSKVKRG